MFLSFFIQSNWAGFKIWNRTECKDVSPIVTGIKLEVFHEQKHSYMNEGFYRGAIAMCFFCCCCYEILYTRTFFRFISTRMITNNVDRKTAFNCESIIPIRPFVLFSVALLTYLRFKQILQNPFVSMGG